jgi:hypothetical protein
MDSCTYRELAHEMETGEVFQSPQHMQLTYADVC